MGGPGRKVVVLGDTYDASGCVGLSQRADLVVHESTNAYLPTLDDSQAEGKKRDGVLISRDSVRATAREHGHSTPEVAGEFARAVGAKGLVMNHLSVKYPDFGEEAREEDGEGTRNVRKMIKEIERLASEAWGGGEARVARDFMEVEIPRRRELGAEQQQ
jgi:ribonuclease Z